MITVYFGSKPVFLTNDDNKVITPYINKESTFILRGAGENQVELLLNKMQYPEVSAGILYGDEQATLKILKTKFHVIQAAGGLVYTENKKILLIFRRGKWDMPKGKLDEGEDLQECAVREVEEETGLKNLVLKEPICVTYHTYKQENDAILKESHGYLIQTNENQDFTPQTNEDIEKCEWVEQDKIPAYKDNMHTSILDVLKNAGSLLKRD